MLLDADPELSAPENRVFATTLRLNTNRQMDWSRIS